MIDFRDYKPRGFTDIEIAGTTKVRLSSDALLDCLDEKAVRFCAKHLYGLFGLRVLKIGNLRKIDLKELFFPFVEYVNDHSNEAGSGNIYIKMIEMYLREFVICSYDSRASQYQSHALGLIKKNYGTDNALTIAEDVFIIFLSLFRSFGKNIEDCKKIALTDINIDIDVRDANIIYALYNNDFFIPQAMCEYKDRIIGGKTMVTPKEEIDKKRAFFYGVSIILLAYFLQEQGYFDSNIKKV